MGNSLAGESQGEIDGNNSVPLGYRVLGVQPASPASKVGLVSFFDFIIAANGIRLCVSDNSFVNMIREFEERELPLMVYNCKCHEVREVVLVPSKNWPGEGMLGMTIRFDTYLNAEENLCRILSVEPDSPAELAGLSEGSDYLLGTAEQVFSDTNVLFDELVENQDTPVDFYVYNSVTDEVRITVLMPNCEWGPDGCGLLGANVAHGYLHSLPQSCCATTGTSNNLLQSALLDADEDLVEKGASGEKPPSLALLPEAPAMAAAAR
jgi:hypothetical protein